MKRFVFWQFDHMGLGSLWQELSFILKFQEEPTTIYTHMNEYYSNRLRVCVENCFAPPKFDLRIEQGEIIHIENAYEKNNQDWFKTSAEVAHWIEENYPYQASDVILYNCDKKHLYWPLRYTSHPRRRAVSFDFIYKDIFGVKPKHHYEHKDVKGEDFDRMVGDLEKNNIEYVNLNAGNMTIPQSCEAMCNTAIYLGREGGWSHIAHSAQIPFVPVMYPKDRVYRGINKAHKGVNPYLKDLVEPKDFSEFLETKLLPYLESFDETLL